MALAAGLTAEFEFEVDQSVATDVAGTVPRKVLATPAMIQKMERAAMLAVRTSLPEGLTSVGFEVCVRHVGSAPLGSKCVSSATLIEVVDRRKLRFEVEVTCDGRRIGVGTHERRVLQAADFAL